MKNYLWNMFANIKNGQLAKKPFIIQTRKNVCEEFLKILWQEGFIVGYTVNSLNPKQLKIMLKYRHGVPVINSIKLISKPGRRIYYSLKQIWKIDSSKSFIILSTSRGLKSIVECKKLRIGGEPFISLN
jgi:small subunit ribosomal protein S8